MAQDYSGQNLQGRSFRGRTDLAGANFSHADIRGADFSNAILTGANFSYCQAGLQKHWAMILLLVALFLSTLSGCVSALAGAITGAALISQNLIEIFAGAFILIALGVFVSLTIRQGLIMALGVWVVAIVVATMVAVLTGATAVAVTLVAASAGAVAAAIAMAVVAAGAAAGAVAAASAVAVVAAGAGVVAAAGSVVVVTAGASVAAATSAATVAVIVAVGVAGLSAYVSWRALIGDKNYTLIRRIAIAFAAIGGTNFQGTDLTEADFTQALLKSTNFRQAKVTRTCWFQAKKLELSRVGTTYLDHPKIRRLVVTGEGQDGNFDNLGLQETNLRGANLVAASFVNSNLSDANLQSANLKGGKLKNTNLDGTDLIGACLVGAYIEEWKITRKTKFDRVQRQYIVRRLGLKKRPKP